MHYIKQSEPGLLQQYRSRQEVQAITHQHLGG